jgi:hypothetical protein
MKRWCLLFFVINDFALLGKSRRMKRAAFNFDLSASVAAGEFRHESSVPRIIFIVTLRQ